MSLLATATCYLTLLASPQQPEQTVTIAGRVVDLRGAGVPVAEVWVEDRAEANKLPREKKLRRTMADAEGYFRLARVPEARYYTVRASKDGYSLGVGYPRGTNPTTRIELHHATTVQGQLLGLDGKPVADTVVTAAPAGRALSRRQIQATTDKDGRFQLTNVPLGLSQVSAWAVGSGLVQLRHRVIGDDTVKLVAAEQATTSFSVTVDGLPKEDGPAVTLRWRPYRRGSYVELPSPLKRPVIENGSWDCEGVPDWEYTVSVAADGWAFRPNEVRVKAGDGPHQLGFVGTRIEVGDDQQQDDQQSGVSCPAVVTDGDGKPVAGVTFVLRKSNGGARATATSDENGALTFASPLAPSTKVVVYSTSNEWVIDQKKTGDMIGSHDRRFLEDHECVVDPDHTLKLRVVAATTVGGRLMHPDGRPAALVRVQIEEEHASRWPRWMAFSWATTDRDGNFAFRRLHHSDEGVRLLVEGVNGTARSDVFSIAEVGGQVKVPVMTLAPPASVQGVVTDAKGKPAPGVTIWLRDWDMANGRQASGSVTEVITDRLGRYRFLGVPIGGAWLQFVDDEDARGGMHQRVVEPFEVEAGQTYTFDLDCDS